MEGKLQATQETLSIISRPEQDEMEVSLKRSIANIRDIGVDFKTVISILSAPQNLYDIRSKTIDTKADITIQNRYTGMATDNKSFIIELDPIKHQFATLTFDGQKFNNKNIIVQDFDPSGYAKFKLPNGITIEFSIDSNGFIGNVIMGGMRPQA
jgi:hypothetical protein